VAVRDGAGPEARRRPGAVCPSAQGISGATDWSDPYAIGSPVTEINAVVGVP
jgi:hypothetical protein